MTRTLIRRAGVIAALAAVAAIAIPGAQAADCTVAKNANCAGQDMRHLGGAMKGKNMSGADLSGADMRGMNLTGMNLTGANLAGAKMDGATMSKANMTGANMTGMTMKNMKMAHATMTKADLSGSTISGGNWSHATFKKAHMTGIKVVKADMSHADFTNATAGGKRGATTRDAVGMKAPYSYFSGVNLNGATFYGADLSYTTFANRTSFQWAQMQGANFSNAAFVDVNNMETFGMRDSNLSNARWVGNTYMPAFASRLNLDGAICSLVGVPESRGIIGQIHSILFDTVGQIAGGGYTAQSQYWGVTYHPPSYDWLWTYALSTVDGATYGSPAIHTIASANNVHGCAIIGAGGLK